MEEILSGRSHGKAGIGSYELALTGLRLVWTVRPFDGLACHPTRRPEVFCWNDLRKWSRQVRVLMRPADHEGKACGRRFKLL